MMMMTTTTCTDILCLLFLVLTVRGVSSRPLRAFLLLLLVLLVLLLHKRYSQACWLVGWLVAQLPSNTLVSTSQQHPSVSQRRICSGNCTCCRTETEAADQTFYFTESQYTDTWPTCPNAGPITPAAWKGGH